MTLRSNPQPEGSEAPEEALKKPTIADAISSLSGPGAPSASDKVALQFPPDICLKIDQFLEQDSDIITTAADDIVSQYYQVVNMFLEHMQKRTCTDTQRVQFLYLKIAKSHHLSQLKRYSFKKRRQGNAKNPLSLLQIFSKWETALGGPNKFSFLSAVQNTDTMTTQSGSLKKTTAGGVAAYNARTTPPAATPTQPPVEDTVKSTLGGTRLAMPVVDFGPDGKIIIPQPVPTAPQPTPTVPEPAETVVKTTNEAATAVTPPPEAPEDDGWHHILAPKDKQLESDIDIFNHPGLPTIIHVHKYRNPASQNGWRSTLKNLETAMAISFDELKGETDKTKIYEHMVNALSKTGSPQYRKRVLQEIHALSKHDKGISQRAITEIFTDVLSNQPEYSRPRKISEAMEIIYEQPNSYRPRPEDMTPDALFKGYSELDKAEITEMPAEVQEPIRKLLEAAREFGLAPVGINAKKVDIAKMTPGNFRLMCANIFHRLQVIEEQVKIQVFKSSTWKWKSPAGKARAFTRKLQEIFAVQFAIIEEFLFSKELFIPEKVRDLA